MPIDTAQETAAAEQPRTAPAMDESAEKKYVRPTLRFINCKTLPLVAFPETKAISTGLPVESDLLSINGEYYAAAASGAGGRIVIARALTKADPELAMRGNRMPAHQMKTIVNGADLLDFALSPFSLQTRYGANTLLAGCEDGACRVWTLATDAADWAAPSNAPAQRSGTSSKLQQYDHATLTDQTVPALQWTAHAARVNTVAWHPTVPGVVVTASPNYGSAELRLWELPETLETASQPRLLGAATGCFSDAIHSVSFSSEGARIAVTTRDGNLYLFELKELAELVPVTQCNLGMQRGPVPFWIGRAGVPGSANGPERLGVVGFARGNDRVMTVLELQGTEAPRRIAQVDLGCSPSLLRPHYDSDVSLVWLMGRGESLITAVDVHPVTGALTLLGRYDTSTTTGASLIGQSMALLPKSALDVRAVQIARCVKLTLNNSFEIATFSVPRAKPQYFQDDLYPDTVDTSKPVFDSADSFFKVLAETSDFTALEPPRTLSLQPSGMQKLGSVPRDLAAEAAQQERARSRRQSALAASSDTSSLQSQMLDNLYQMVKGPNAPPRRASRVSVTSNNDSSLGAAVDASAIANAQLQTDKVSLTRNASQATRLSALSGDDDDDNDDLERERRRRILIGQAEEEVKEEEWD